MLLHTPLMLFKLLLLKEEEEEDVTQSRSSKQGNLVSETEDYLAAPHEFDQEGQLLCVVRSFMQCKLQYTKYGHTYNDDGGIAITTCKLSYSLDQYNCTRHPELFILPGTGILRYLYCFFHSLHNFLI